MYCIGSVDVSVVIYTCFSINRQSCYMLRADELYNEVTQDATGKGASQGMFIGCFLDVATGYMTFTCEGKETSHKFRVSFMCFHSSTLCCS